jgi:urease gamma subunit
MSVQQRKGISFSAVQRIAVCSAAIPENARRGSRISGVTERLVGVLEKKIRGVERAK